jgi:hypothetical protein
LDFALAQLALVFMPGIIWANIDAKYGAGLKPTPTILVVRAFLFGMATYTALYLIYGLCEKSFGYATLGTNTERVYLSLLKDEIAWSIPLSFVLSIFWLWAVRNRLLMKFLHKIRASNRYGDEDVWSFTLNADQARVEYVHFRDLENGYIFAGWINSYSENEDYRELLLRDVIVYDEEGAVISSPPNLYISRPKSNIWMEFPYREEGYDNVRQDADDTGDNQ